MLCQPASHRWRLLNRFVVAAEVVPSDEQCRHRGMMRGRLAVSIGQPSEPANVHSDAEVQPLAVARRNIVLVRIAEANYFLDTGYRRWAVASLGLARRIALDELPFFGTSGPSPATYRTCIAVLV